MTVPLSLTVLLVSVHVSLGFVVSDQTSRSSAKFSTLPSPEDDVLNSESSAPHAMKYKSWGVDKDRDEEYWFNDKIHSLGNTGFRGAVHAAMAPLATHIIDKVAYDGHDIRESIAKELAKSINNSKARVVDLCCGVGISTRALQHAFPDAGAVIGVDTSPEMISMTKLLSYQQCRMQPLHDFFSHGLRVANKSINLGYLFQERADVKAKKVITMYTCANAENTPLPDRSFDLVTIMYAFHESPQIGREKMLAEAARLLNKGGLLALVDITPDYVPNPTMLAGEPYVLEYQQNISHQLRMVKGFAKATFRDLVPGHVGVWLLRRCD